MALQHAMCPAAPQTRRFRLPDCPHCGDMLLAPMLSEHVSERVVRNHWVCESCGYTFRKSVDFVSQLARRETLPLS